MKIKLMIVTLAVAIAGIANAAPVTQGRHAYFGKWKIVKYVFPGVSAMDNVQADQWVGNEVEYGPAEVIGGGERCEEPAYSRKRVNADKYFKGSGTDGSVALKLGLYQESVEVLTIRCGKKPWVSRWSQVILLSDDRLMVTWDGAFFTLERVKKSN